MTNAFEYGDALLPEMTETEGESPSVGNNQPYLNLATFRMVVLADEVLESFFETDLSESFKLQDVPDSEIPTSASGFLGDIWSSIATDSNKKIFNMFTDEIGKTIGKHQVVHRPSIGRYTKLEEPKARESLLTPTLRKSSSNASLVSPPVSPSATKPPAQSTATSSTLTVNTSLEPPKMEPGVPETGGLSAMPMIQAANAALLERPQFAIDDAKDDEDEDDSDLEDVDNDDQVMDEVDAFLEAHDSGLTAADQAVAQDLRHAEPMK